MKVSSRIGSFIAALIMAFAFGVSAGECDEKDISAKFSHTLKTDDNLICIGTRDDRVEISVYRNDGEATPVSQNSILLENSDIEDETVRLEPYNNGFQIYLEYPTSIYLIEFDSDAKHLVGSYISMKLRSTALDLPPQKITLALSPQKLGSLKFDSLTKSLAFDQIFLTIKQSLRTTVTAQRTDILVLPKESSSSKGYLVLGESVEVVNYENGWIGVNYKNSDHIKVSGWIRLSDIL